MAKRDFYEVLGVERGVSRGRAEKSLPAPCDEASPGPQSGDKAAEDAFKEAKRPTKYSPIRANGLPTISTATPVSIRRWVAGAAGAGYSGANFSDIFGDVFSDFFSGGRGGRGGAQRGGDLRYTLELDLEEQCAAPP